MSINSHRRTVSPIRRLPGKLHWTGENDRKRRETVWRTALIVGSVLAILATTAPSIGWAVALALWIVAACLMAIAVIV